MSDLSKFTNNIITQGGQTPISTDNLVKSVQSDFVKNAVNQLPFSPIDIGNQLQQFGQFGSNAVANELNELTAGGYAAINQQLPFPGKKLVTFYLNDSNGNMVTPTDNSFQPGYLFNMYVNPSTFNISYPTKQINEIRTMGGWQFQHWYPNIGQIQVNGMIGNMLQKYNTDVKKSPAWDGFKKLLRIYLKNGVVYSSNKGIRLDQGKNNREFNPIAICTYDRVSYHGYFENFSLEETQESPYTRNYSFVFKFVDMIDVQDIVEITKDSLTTKFNDTIKSSPFGSLSNSVGSFINSTGNGSNALKSITGA